MPSAAIPAIRAFDDLLDRSNLTDRQFLIYAGQRLHPGIALYNSVYAIRWSGLDLERFQLVWQDLIDSCDALRMVIDEVEGVPQQRVLPSFAASVDRVDLRVESPAEPALEDWITARLRRPMILNQR